MRKYILGCIALMCIFFQGCFIFGIKTHHFNWTDKSDYKKVYRRNRIKDKEEFYLDTTFTRRMKTMYANDTIARHDHVQPVQYLLFDKQGKLKSFMINCFAHTNMLLYANWDHEHLFDTFPAKTMRPVDDLLTLPDILKTMRDTSGKVPDIAAGSYDYVEVVIFSSVLYRVSKELIHTVKHQDKKGYHVKTLFVNSDDNFLWPYMNTAEKRKVLEYSPGQ